MWITQQIPPGRSEMLRLLRRGLCMAPPQLRPRLPAKQLPLQGAAG